MLEVRLLGRFEVKHDQKSVNISSRSGQSLFAYLILNPGRAHRREKLAGVLWPELSKEKARDNLRHALWRVRKALQSASAANYLQADDISIAFNASAEYWLDAMELEKLSERAPVDELSAVLSLYQGELLPGFYEAWVDTQREHAYSLFEHYMARLLLLLQEQKRWPDVMLWGERWIKWGQQAEPAYRALMNAHAAHDDLTKVAATYERCVKSLGELGVEPSEQTHILYQILKKGKGAAGTGAIYPDAKEQMKSRKTNLPVPFTRFIGREREIEEVRRLLSATRLLSLTGAGGLGKTRLAIESSKGMLNRFKDGAWWVELAALMDEALIPRAVAQALHVREAPGQPLTESLKGFLRQKQLLLVLDNCEHLIAGCAQFAEEFLIHCPELKILTTSREALAIPGEKVWTVPVLSLPNLPLTESLDALVQYEAIHLFVERASTVNPDFVLTESNMLSVVHICQRLDGVPLAIELAAARAQMMSVNEIARHLDDRFDLLSMGSRTALPRHQTLRAAVDWSYDLLTQSERALFQRLAVFAGGFSLDAAEEVCSFGTLKQSQILQVLGQLVAKSLVVVDGTVESRVRRYRLLETIREYARQKLFDSDEADVARRRHRDFFIAFAEQAEPKLQGSEQIEWLDRLEVEQENWRAAWTCAFESDAGLASRLASALLGFWLMRGNPSEGRELLAKLQEQSETWGPTALRARVFNVAGRLAHYQADFLTAQSLLEQALSIARTSGDKREIAFALLWLGRTALRQRDGETAAPLIAEGFAIYRELQDEWGTALAYQRSAELAGEQGDQGKAEEFFLQTLARYRAFGNRFMIAEVLNALGEVMRFASDYDRAGTFYQQALAILEEIGDRFTKAIPMFGLAWVLIHRGDYSKAITLLETSLKLHREYGYKRGMAEECLCGFAAILAMMEKPEPAARLFGAVESLLESLEMTGQREAQDQKEVDRYLAKTRDLLNGPSFAKAWEEGRSMSLDEAIEFALEETKQ